MAAAHERGLELEAWINPYRLQAGVRLAAVVTQARPGCTRRWVKYTDTGAYLDPASAAVRQYIADSVEELCAGYAIDGIHFDDYFLPHHRPGV